MNGNNTWNIRRLVDEAFVPATQHIILKIVIFESLLQKKERKNVGLMPIPRNIFVSHIFFNRAVH